MKPFKCCVDTFGLCCVELAGALVGIMTLGYYRPGWDMWYVCRESNKRLRNFLDEEG